MESGTENIRVERVIHLERRNLCSVNSRTHNLPKLLSGIGLDL